MTAAKKAPAPPKKTQKSTLPPRPPKRTFPRGKRPKRDPETGEFPILLMKWQAPDYAAIIQRRIENLARIRDNARENPGSLVQLKAFYAKNIDAFINDWGWTYDPRNAEIGLPTIVPMVLFERQRKFIKWILAKWEGRERALCEKSRDVGASWIAMAVACSLCLFHDNISIGFGSRKTEYVDSLRSLKPLLPKGRMFLRYLPEEFRGGFVEWRDAPFMKIVIPDTGSMIGGEGGDDIGRGDRTSLYFVDEYAHFERPHLTEASLSMTTNCRIDMSSVRGMNNPFAEKRWSGKVDVFIFDWTEDPRKDQAWYDKQCTELDPVVVAQEIDRDYNASVTGIVIPGAWVKAAVGAREALGIALSGERGLALDVADEGVDKNALCHNYGIEVCWVKEMSGKGGDIFKTVQWVFGTADELGVNFFEYDADGIGASVRGDARVINEGRRGIGKRSVRAVGYRGSAAVVDPDGIVEGTIGIEGDKGRTNQDYFMNRKAQSWWNVRRLFRNTYRWVVEKVPCAPDEIISISKQDPEHQKTVAELSQATFAPNNAGKIVINKTPNGQKSPNRADAIVIRYGRKDPGPMVIGGDVIAAIAAAGRASMRSRAGRIR